MRTLLRSSLWGAALGVLVLTGNAPAGAQTGKPMPAWDQKLRCPTEAACTRFVVLTDFGSAAVLDRETGLVWERSPDPATLDWVQAHSNCNANGTTFPRPGGRLGWRLPTIQELNSLVEPGQTDPALPPGHPFLNVKSDVSEPEYWSATTSTQFPNTAWGTSFFNGSTGGVFPKSNAMHVWCVRGGQGVDPQ